MSPPRDARSYFLLAVLIGRAGFLGSRSAGADLPSMTLVIMSPAGVQTAPISGSLGK